MADAAQQVPIPFPVPSAMGRHDFIVSDCNREALGWVERWPDWGTHALYLYGPSGCGRTHLAHIWAKQAEAEWLDASHIPDYLDSGRAGCVVLEDMDRWFGDTTAEEHIFHLYNHLKLQGGALLMSGDKPLTMALFKVADVASRLRSAPQIAIHTPDEALLRTLMIKLFTDRQMRIDAAVIDYALPRIERSFACVRELVTMLDTRSIAEKKPINIGMLRGLLKSDTLSLF